MEMSFCEAPATPERTPPQRRAHKWNRIRPPSADWRKRLLDGCSKRIRETNTYHDSKRRKHLLLREAARHPSFMPEPDVVESEFDQLLADLDRLLKCRQEEEEQLINAFESMCKDESKDVEELLESQHGVVCPVCGGCLLLRQGRAFCKCGVSVGGELSEDFVKHQLAMDWEKHQRCTNVKHEMKGQFLWTICSTCNSEDILL